MIEKSAQKSKPLKILIFSHSSSFGGAEKALVDLVNLLISDHEISVVVPAAKGALNSYFKKMGVELHHLPIGFSSPNLPKFLYDFCGSEKDDLVQILKETKYDLVISNTLVSLQGALISKDLNVPHILWAHENLDADIDLSTCGYSPQFYLKTLSGLSGHILCGSKYTEQSIAKYSSKTSVLYPFTPYEVNDSKFGKKTSKLGSKLIAFFKKPFQHDFKSVVSLLVIGTKSLRKNSHFSITVLKALRLRGINAELHVIGHGGSGKLKFKRQHKIRSEKNIFFHRHLSNPYLLGGKKRINLVCANSEPFGLTVPESLYLGIPNISSRCGGPEEILDAEYTYEVDDVDGCVRAIERIISDYDFHSNKAKNAYMRFASINSIEKRTEIVNSVISSTVNNFSNFNHGTDDKIDWSDFQFLKKDFLTKDDLLETIAEVAAANCLGELYGDVKNNHELEIKSPGRSALADLCRFNAVPFSYSPQMREFYKYGLGLAIELAANAFDSNKKLMLGYILLALYEKQASTSHPVNVLFLGDGLGFDALKISAYEFNVDYLDVENSLISQCASINFKKAAVNLGRNLPITICDKLIKKYDAIVCLEVIEHVPGPSDFLKYIHSNLKEDGILLISECFDGIYDRWPAHLYENEKFSMSLPILALPYFHLLNINKQPYAKPYLFKKRAQTLSGFNNYNFLLNDNFLQHFINSKLKIGF